MKKTMSVLIMLLLLFITYEILSESQTIIKVVLYSFNIWINNIFPSLFPFFVLSSILSNYGLPELIGELFKPLFEKVFKINGNAAFVFFMSLISGFPSNSKYTKELYEKGILNEHEATKILMFSHFANPLFILGFIYSFLNDKNLCLLIMFSHYFANIVIGFLVRNYYPSKLTNDNFSIKRAINKMHYKRINNDSLGSVITNSLINTINTLLLILGVVTTCLIITTIIDNNLNLNLINKTFISGFLEMTQGLKHVSLLNSNSLIKSVLVTSILSFGGLSVHLQIISIINNTKIKYIPFLLARILHVIVSVLLLLIIFKIM